MVLLSFKWPENEAAVGVHLLAVHANPIRRLRLAVRSVRIQCSDFAEGNAFLIQHFDRWLSLPLQ